MQYKYMRIQNYEDLIKWWMKIQFPKKETIELKKSLFGSLWIFLGDELDWDYDSTFC